MANGIDQLAISETDKQALINDFNMYWVTTKSVGSQYDTFASQIAPPPVGFWRDIWQNALADKVYLSTAERIQLQSDNGSDSVLGTGARRVTIQGILDNGEFGQETLDMAGTGLTTASLNRYVHINKMFVADSGTVGGANGNIVAYGDVTGLAAPQGYIKPFVNLSNDSHFRVPGNRQGVIRRFSVSIYAQPTPAPDRQAALFRYVVIKNLPGAPRIISPQIRVAGDSLPGKGGERVFENVNLHLDPGDIFYLQVNCEHTLGVAGGFVEAYFV